MTNNMSLSGSIDVGRYTDMLLLGGGQLCRNLCKWGISNDYRIRVLTSPRHAEEVVENERFDKFLDNKTIPFLISKQLDSVEVNKFVGDVQSTFCLSLGAAWIFDEQSIEKLFDNRLFNLHGTRLPQNRGGRWV